MDGVDDVISENKDLTHQRTEVQSNVNHSKCAKALCANCVEGNRACQVFSREE